MTPSWIDPARFRRVLVRAMVMPLLVMGALAVGLVYQLNHLFDVSGTEPVSVRVLGVGVGVTLLLGGLLALFGRRQLLELSRGYGRAIELSTQHAAALRQSEARFRAIFEGARDAMVIVDDDAHLVDANPAASRLFGRPQEALLGKRIWELTELDAGAEQTAECFKNSRAVRGELRVRRPDGLVLFTEFHATPNLLPGRHLSVLRDITERRHHEEEVRRLNESLERRVQERTAQLEAANRELESFSYSVSHDLRSPLRHIHGFTDLLRKSAGASLTEQGSRYLETIGDAAKKASTLVDELLAFSRMGRTELRDGEVDMSLLVEEVRREVERDAEGRAIRWSVGPLPNVRGDAPMLRQVLRNLLSNAVKYTRPRQAAEVTVACEVLPGGEWVFQVRDNGVGFDMDYVDRLFGVFKRLHGDAEFEGTGIGLANVRRIVQRHGGRTWAEGEVDRGATFFFTLPAVPAQKERTA